MSKKTTFWIVWYTLGVALLGFYVLSAPHLAQVVAKNMPKINPYINVAIADGVGAFGMFYCPFLWKYTETNIWKGILLLSIVVLVFGTLSFNVLAWR